MTSQIVRDFRRLHQRPELAWTEYGTAAFAIERLRSIGWHVRNGVDVCGRDRLGVPARDIDLAAYDRAHDAGYDADLLASMKGGYTGAIAEWRYGDGGPTIGVRIELDANVGNESSAPEHLPVRHGYRSQYPGIHHSCGHDAHLAIALESAARLATSTAIQAGSVRLLLQPGEEGLKGAASLVSGGALDDVDHLIGFHLGIKATRSGTLIPSYHSLLASCKYDVSFHGAAAHAGLAPEVGKNALLAAATAVTQLHGIARHGTAATRINVGSLVSIGARNAVPDNANLLAEVRATGTAGLEHMQQRFTTIVEAAGAMHETDVRVARVGYAAAADSSPELRRIVEEIAHDLPSKLTVLGPTSFGASDDISTMMNHVQRNGGQALFFGIGSDLGGPHHSPRFSIDESVLPGAADVLTSLISRLLRTE